MTRQPRPPRPETTLDRLLRRLQDDLDRVSVDPDFGRRVEARIRVESVRHARGQRSIPGWAAIAAGILLTLGAGLSTQSAPAPLDRGVQAPLAPPPEPAPEPEPPLPDLEEPPPEAERVR